MKEYVGIDIGGTSVKAAIVTEQGKIVRRSAIPTLATRPYREIADDIAKQITELYGGKPQGVGIGCPGAVDNTCGVIRYSNNLYWKDVPLADELHKRLGAQILICNDANAAALGEARFGAGKEYSDTAFITLGTGVGGGIVVGGKLFEGYRGMGAEIGHMVIRSGGVLCTCGRRGCLESYASATALIRETTFAMQTDRNSAMWAFCDGDLNKVDGRTAFECAKKGDVAAQGVVDAYVEALAEGITNVVNVFRSQAVIIGGGVSAQGDYLLKALQKHVDAKRYGGADSLHTKLVIASLGNDAGVIGAAGMLIPE